jgi:hypothetical protein
MSEMTYGDESLLRQLEGRTVVTVNIVNGDEAEIVCSDGTVFRVCNADVYSGGLAVTLWTANVVQ